MMRLHPKREGGFILKIYTLGTSHGATEKGRACSGTLLCVGGANYLLDCGGNMEGKMTDMELSIEDTRCVFISHMHEDHVGTLSSIAKRFVSYNRNDAPIRIFMPEEDGIEAFKHWLLAMHTTRLETLIFGLVREGIVYEDENITVTAIPTEHLLHGAFPSFAYVIRVGEKKILYTGDLDADFHDYPEIVFEEEFDAIVCELVHFNLRSNLEAICRSKTKKMIFTHLSPYQIPKILSVKERFPFPVYIAEDGMCFDL
jgi:ribonuclease BN (tRNA processing enzyme)